MTENEGQMESLLLRYYDGELRPEEIREVEAWMNASESNMEIARQVYCICLATDEDLHKTEKSVDADAALTKTRKRIAAGRFRRTFRFIEHAAAVLLIPVAGLAFWLAGRFADNADSTVEIRSTTGMVSCVILPDDSKVWLNSDSYLKYPARFRKERRVTLSGEGYFEVAKDARRKFVVEAGPTEVVVHGTEFNVEAYGDEIRTTLVSGSVSVIYEDSSHQDKMLCMQPFQQAVYNSLTGSMELRQENVLCDTSWKDGKIILDNTPLEDALRMIGNKYNVRFNIIDGNVKKYNFTGTFSNQSLDRIMHYFSISSDIHFRQTDSRQADRDGQSGRTVFEVY